MDGWMDGLVVLVASRYLEGEVPTCTVLQYFSPPLHPKPIVNLSYQRVEIWIFFQTLLLLVLVMPFGEYLRRNSSRLLLFLPK